MLGSNYRHTIELQRPVPGQDPATGAPITTWVTTQLDDGTLLDAVPADVLTGPGRQLIAAGAVQAEADARIKFRWFPELSTTWRVVWDGMIYSIQGVPERDKTGRREWRLRCKAGLTTGT